MKCSVRECKRETRNLNRVYCDAHLMQLRRHGKIIINKSKDKNCRYTHKYTHTSYRAMLQRCSPKNQDHKYYKDKGICDRWTGLDGWDNFFDDMGERPKNLTIERIDNSKGYCKENCKWASRKEQARNTSSIVYITWENKKYTVIELCEKLQINNVSVISKVSKTKIKFINAINSLLYRKIIGSTQCPTPKKYSSIIKKIENDLFADGSRDKYSLTTLRL